MPIANSCFSIYSAQTNKNENLYGHAHLFIPL
jgi:hypothetical protein